MILKLIVKRGPKRIKELTFKGSTINIGSAKGNNIVLKGEDIAESHCSIIKGKEGGYYIHSDEAPVSVNGMRVEEKDLLEGDIINIGVYTIIPRFIEESQVSGYLFAIDGPLKGKKFLITSSSTVGRVSSNDIVIDEPSVSKHHFRLIVKGENLYIEDMGSRNGTILNNKVIEKGILKQGDRIKIGDTSLLFLKSDAPYIKMLYNRMFGVYIALGIIVITIFSIGMLRSAREKSIENAYNSCISEAKKLERNGDLMDAIEEFSRCENIKPNRRLEQKIAELKNQLSVKDKIEKIGYYIKNGPLTEAEKLIEEIKGNEENKDTILALMDSINERKKIQVVLKKLNMFIDNSNINSFLTLVDSLLSEMPSDIGEKMYEKSVMLGDKLLGENRLKNARKVYTQTKKIFVSMLSDSEMSGLDERIKMTARETPPPSPVEPGKEIQKIPSEIRSKVIEWMQKAQKSYVKGEDWEKNYYQNEDAREKYEEAMRMYEIAYDLIKDDYFEHPLTKKIKQKMDIVKQALERVQE